VQRTYLALHLVCLGRRRLWESSEQSRHHGYVLACPGEAWEPIAILNDSPVRVAGMRTHLIMVLRDLVLECHTLLFQMEPRGLELLLSLP
jgi:hypothetical protein